MAVKKINENITTTNIKLDDNMQFPSLNDTFFNSPSIHKSYADLLKQSLPKKILSRRHITPKKKVIQTTSNLITITNKKIVPHITPLINFTNPTDIKHIMSLLQYTIVQIDELSKQHMHLHNILQQLSEYKDTTNVLKPTNGHSPPSPITSLISVSTQDQMTTPSQKDPSKTTALTTSVISAMDIDIQNKREHSSILDPVHPITSINKLRKHNTKNTLFNKSKTKFNEYLVPLTTLE